MATTGCGRSAQRKVACIAVDQRVHLQDMGRTFFLSFQCASAEGFADVGAQSANCRARVHEVMRHVKGIVRIRFEGFDNDASYPISL